MAREQGVLQRYSDVVVAALVVSIVGMMIVPLPTQLLDLLITLNISISVLMLLTAIYVTNALKISVFPTLLLLTTLFRLSLNVSSSRLILIQANAGQVIRAFGQFVVHGNYVVGAVIFVILTLIQFIVISKGSERVAEVAARFTLDAMPGKQMSIDADLRSGAIEQEEGKTKRRNLERESQLYGAMDGAMKFVKGDAIAGMIITVINIVGGLIIGILQRGMPAGDAARVYTVLTIGDGLVSQIPALLISTSAGIIVTRVGGEEEDAHLGSDIIGQLTAQPKALTVAGVMMVVLGCVPGLPTVPFLVMGFAATFAGYTLLRREANEEALLEGAGAPPGSVQAIEPGARAPLNPESEMFVPVVTPIVLEVSAALTPFVDSRQDGGRFLSELVPLMRDGLFVELGVRFPGVRARANVNLAPGAYQIQINEVPVASGQVVSGQVLVSDTPERLKLMGIEGTPTLNPATRTAASWVPAESRAALEAAGLTVWEPPSYLVLHLAQVLRSHAREFLGVQETQAMVDQLEKAYPALVKEVVPKLVSAIKLTEILGRLVEEEIGVRDLRGILQCLAEHAQTETDGVMLTEHVRASFRRYISHKHARGGNTLVVYMLDPQIEDAIRGAIKHTSAGSHLALEPDLAMEIVQAVKRHCGHLPASAQRPVFLTAMDIRRYVRKLLEHELPTAFSVVSYQELSSEMNIQPVARVSLA